MHTFQLKKGWLSLLIVVVAMLFWAQSAAANNNVVVTVINLSNRNVCRVYLSPANDDVWTGEKLGNSQMANWAKRTFSISTGTYDLQADFCDGSSRLAIYDVSITSAHTWEIGKGADGNASTPASGGSATTNTSTSNEQQWQAEPSNRETTLNELFQFYEEDVHQFWVRDSAARGMTYVRPTVNYGWRTDSHAFYDPSNHSIGLNRLFANNIKSKLGDFSVATVLAHEWGHAIQANYGYASTFSFTIHSEANADCLTGAYAQDVENRGIIDSSDIAAGRALMSAVGDNYPWWHRRAHGSSAARVNSFNQGYWGGTDACVVE